MPTETFVKSTNSNNCKQLINKRLFNVQTDTLIQACCSKNRVCNKYPKVFIVVATLHISIIQYCSWSVFCCVYFLALSYYHLLYLVIILLLVYLAGLGQGCNFIYLFKFHVIIRKNFSAAKREQKP